MLENLSSIASSMSSSSFASSSAPSGVLAMLRCLLAAEKALNSLTTLRGGEEGGEVDEGMPEAEGRGGREGEDAEPR